MDHLQNMISQDMNLVLSTDAKPRLKWTPELHQQFVDAVNQLGGPERATPKGLMRVMGIPGLTLYHLKSHLQKYRLGINQQHSETCSESKSDAADYKENPSINMLKLFSEEKEINDPTQNQINENIRISQAIEIQMEVQKKLHEQIEVQRHLQLRIEAQGKYLQKVLKKAHETISNYNCSETGLEHAKAELSQLVSMVNSSSFSGLTDATDLSCTMRYTGCSNESSLNSSESSGRRDEEFEKGSHENCMFILPLLDDSRTQELGSRKRNRNTVYENNWVEQTGCKKSKFGFLETIDLNSQCGNDLDLGSRQPIDLNSKE